MRKSESLFGKVQQYAFVIKQLSHKDNKRKTDETNLGILWNVLNPLLYMIILSTYYQNVIIHDIENFPVFVFTGITMLNFYSTGTMGAMRSLVGNKNLLIKSQLSMRIYIYQRVFLAFKEMCFSAIALIPIMWFFNIGVSWRVLQIIPIIVITIIIVSSIGQILAVVYVFFADIDYLYSVLMTLMFFVSGTFIPLEHMPQQFQTVLTYNPIFLSIYLSRNSLIYNLPSHWTAWIKIIIWALVLMIISNLIFKRIKNQIISKL